MNRAYSLLFYMSCALFVSSGCYDTQSIDALSCSDEGVQETTPSGRRVCQDGIWQTLPDADTSPDADGSSDMDVNQDMDTTSDMDGTPDMDVTQDMDTTPDVEVDMPDMMDMCEEPDVQKLCDERRDETPGFCGDITVRACDGTVRMESCDACENDAICGADDRCQKCDGPEYRAEKCGARMCGILTVQADACGAQREIECGTCGADELCDPAGMCFCPKPECDPAAACGFATNACGNESVACNTFSGVEGACDNFDMCMPNQTCAPITLTPPNRQSGAWFGYSVAVSDDGQTIVVGEPTWTVPGMNGRSTGRIHVFERRPNGSWMSSILSFDPVKGPPLFTGIDVDIDGDLIAVTTYSQDNVADRPMGVVLFHRNAGTWTESSQINMPFPLIVSLDGTRLAVSEPSSNGEVGQVRVWECNASGFNCDATPPALVTPSSNAADLNFGWRDLLLKGDRMVVGAPRAINGANVGERQRGEVYSFERQADGSWVQRQVFSQNTSLSNTTFLGTGLAFDGSLIYMGAPSYLNYPLNGQALFGFDGAGDDAPNDGGAFYAASFANAPSSVVLGAPVASLSQIGDGLGTSMSMSDGLLIVSAPDYNDAQNIRDTGLVQLRRYNTNGVLSFLYDYEGDGIADSYHGFSVDTNGEYVVIGAPRENFYQGRVRVLHIPKP